MDDMKNALEAVCRLLYELDCRYECHVFGDEAYGWLKSGEYSITVKNPNADRNMDIDFQSEASLFFAEWHGHFPFEESKELCAVIKGIVRNELCSTAHFHGDDLRWGGSCLSCRDKPRIFDFQRVDTVDETIAAYAETWNGSKDVNEIRFKFWDTKFDRTVVIGENS